MDDQIPEKRAKLENEKVSTGWFDLPFEMREMIMKEMNFKTLCVFVQCSQLCEVEVKELEKFKFNITLSRQKYRLPYHLELGFGHSKEIFEDENLYCLKFFDMPSPDMPKTEVVYFKTDTDEIEKWRRVENGNAEEVRLRYFDDFIDEYYEKIDNIEIYEDMGFPAWKYDMRKLKNLEKIRNNSGWDLLTSEVFDLSQITNTDTVEAYATNVTFEQIINLNGWMYELKSDDINEAKISRLLKMFQKGKLKFEMLQLHLNLYSLPDLAAITEGLDVLDTEDKWILGERTLLIIFYDYERRYCEFTLTQRRLYMYVE